MISKILQILSLQPRISKVFSRSLEQSFLTVSQNNFGNKIPFSCVNLTQSQRQNHPNKMPSETSKEKIKRSSILMKIWLVKLRHSEKSTKVLKQSSTCLWRYLVTLKQVDDCFKLLCTYFSEYLNFKIWTINASCFSDRNIYRNSWKTPISSILHQKEFPS